MKFSETIEQASDLLQQKGRLSYRTLKLEFDLSEEQLEALKEELIDVQELAVDKDSKMLVWVGEHPVVSRQHSVVSREKDEPQRGAFTDPRPLTPDPRSYTPNHLAEKILQSKSALEGERKQVTVLFADVKGSMELAEQLDPGRMASDSRSLLCHSHRRRASLRGDGEPVHRRRHHGAVWRADCARGSCPARLLRRARIYASVCANTLMSYVFAPGVNFSFRLALNSGEVIVGKIGDDLRMDYTAQGHTVRLAQRIEQLALTHGIALSQHTHETGRRVLHPACAPVSAAQRRA